MKTIANVFKQFDNMIKDLEKIAESMKVKISKNNEKIANLSAKILIDDKEFDAARKGINRIYTFMN